MPSSARPGTGGLRGSRRAPEATAGMATRRCAWAESNELFFAYHDEEWGVPEHGDRRLFEMLNLEGAQAGLSWLTILRKRANYRRAFDRFDAAKIARYTAAKRAALLRDEGIVRNRLKAKAVAASEAMSRDLRKRGFRFVGPTICYAFMQAVGMVDDHAPGCFRARKSR